MNVLVTGATGAVGPSVVWALREAGHTVRTFSMDRMYDKFPAKVDERIGNIIDSAAVQYAMRGVDAVIHLAALLHIINPSPELREKYKRINVSGTENVIEAAAEVGVKRIVLASTIAVYGPSSGQILNEDSIPCPDNIYSQTKLAAERIVMNAKSAEGLPIGTVLRFGAVYGARIKGNYQRLVRALESGRFLAVGDGSNRRTLIYDKDLAQAAVLAVSHPAAAGQVFNVTDCKFHTMREIMMAMSLALGRIPPRYSLPTKPARWAAGLLEDVARVTGCQSPIVRATIDKYTEDIAVSGDKICRLLDFNPQYDLPSGWREVVDDMRKTGDL